MKDAGYLMCLKKESVNKKNHKQAISNSRFGLKILQKRIMLLCKDYRIKCTLSIKLAILSSTTDKLVWTENVKSSTIVPSQHRMRYLTSIKCLKLMYYDKKQ